MSGVLYTVELHLVVLVAVKMVSPYMNKLLFVAQLLVVSEVWASILFLSIPPNSFKALIINSVES